MQVRPSRVACLPAPSLALCPRRPPRSLLPFSAIASHFSRSSKPAIPPVTSLCCAASRVSYPVFYGAPFGAVSGDNERDAFGRSSVAVVGLFLCGFGGVLAGADGEAVRGEVATDVAV